MGRRELRFNHFMVHAMRETETLTGEPRSYMRSIIKYMESSRRFIFQSAGDVDEDFRSAIHDSAVSMMEAGLFHLPFPSVWIEDSYEWDQVPDATRRMMTAGIGEESARLHVSRMRMLTLAIEEGKEILMWNIFYQPSLHDRKIAEYVVNYVPLRINLDRWEEVPADEASHGLKQLVVSLATRQMRQTHVPGREFKPKSPVLSRLYDYYEVSIDPDRVVYDGRATASGTDRRRKYELVRCYTWGKNTRPREEQRWVAPYWRGDPGLGTYLKAVYVVNTK